LILKIILNYFYFLFFLFLIDFFIFWNLFNHHACSHVHCRRLVCESMKLEAAEVALRMRRVLGHVTRVVHDSLRLVLHAHGHGMSFATMGHEFHEIFP
jgi:hypothetical protein